MITKTIIFKLGIATLLGSIIGLERELRKKPLGLKTSTVIAIASCLITIVSIESAYSFPRFDHINMDPLRLAAQIISGIGFLGAGVILVKGLTVTGLTTAAMIWGASGLGVAVGAGFWKEASIALFFMILSIELLPVILKKIGPGKLREKELELTLIVDKNTKLESLQKELESKDMIIHGVRVRDLSTGEIKLIYSVSTYEKRDTINVYKEIRPIKGIVTAEVTSVN